MRRPPRLVWFALAAGAAFVTVAVYPISSEITRVASVVLLVSFVLLTAAAGRRSRSVLFAIIALVVTSGALMLGPGRGVNDPRLTEQYRAELLGYRGVRYVWGGENHVGIDCSGLVRCALVNAALERGVVTFNPSLVRFGLSLWWHDRSARELGDGFRGETTPVAAAANLNAVDASGLHVGDLAVTVSGLHVLAYAGDGVWIEADPDAHAVVTVRSPDKKNHWFTVPIRIVRWRVLGDHS